MVAIRLLWRLYHCLATAEAQTRGPSLRHIGFERTLLFKKELFCLKRTLLSPDRGWMEQRDNHRSRAKR
jgi:hypothetical protein